ncbi:BED-type domain-containing protein [Citrus sinensis]|uniref:BED-type domain-containing protein n=1 Tax=Citrus sinensis TaxID=2711 RepID=A0ACB8KJ63_CITSI|nr:BED-type domain-containing protein [Citrus sinensis]
MVTWQHIKNTNDVIPLEGVQEVEEASRDDDGVEQSSNKKKRGMREPSYVWGHFTKVTINSELKAKCNHCQAKLVASGHNGTSHLDRHLKKSCKAKGVPSVLDSLQKTLSVTRKDDGPSCIETREFDPIVARQKIATLVGKHELPLNFVEYEAFRDLMSYANPLVKNLSRNTLKSEIFKLYQAEKAKAMALLENNDSRVAITTDMWTASNQKKWYMVVTGHFVDKSWRLQSRILRFIYLPASHTAEFLSEAFFKCMLDWNVDRRISVVTLDNCSTNDAIVDRLMGLISVDSMLMGGNFFHMRCVTHILNLIVKDEMKVIEEWIKKIRDSVAYWTGTPKRVETFEMAARQLQVKCEKKLVLDCVTRWNSTYVMLDVAVKYKIVFSRLQQRDKHYTSLPTDEEWEMAEKMLEYLLPFYSMTELFSGTQYPTSNLFFPMICEMRINLDEWDLSNVHVVREMTGQMIMKFDKYWAQIHGILVMAVILDPRFKIQLVNYYFPQLYGEGAANEIQRVRNLSNDLVKFYEVKSGNVSDAVVGEFSSADVCFNFNLGTGRKFFDIRKFEAFASQNSETIVSKSDLERYLEEPLIKSTSNFDILNWWKVNQGKYPILAQMAKDILAIPVTAVASESTFSTGGRVLTPHRSRLHPTTLEALMCTQHWLWVNSKGKILESEIFNGEEFVDEDESGPQALEYFF